MVKNNHQRFSETCFINLVFRFLYNLSMVIHFKIVYGVEVDFWLETQQTNPY